MVTIDCNGVTFTNIQAVILDKDGTLADSASFLRNLALRRSRLIDAQIPGVQDPLLMAFGVDNQQLNPAGLMAIGTRWENEIAAAAYVAETGRDWMEALAIVRSAFAEADQVMQQKADQTPLIDGAFDLIQRLFTAQLKLGMLSSDTTRNVNDFVERYQLDTYFSLTLGTDGKLAKPDPAFLEQACAALDISPANTLLIGDSQADIQLAQAAKAAGCIAVTCGGNSKRHLLQANVVAEHLNEIEIQT
jgi:phosphoglycolate phosphatase